MATTTRADSQISALAGELFVAAELLKRGLQTSVTFGNAKAIDLLAYNQATRRSFTVQVKALRSNNYFLLNPSRVDPSHVYVFVLLGKPGVPVRYFIVPGQELAADRKKFGKAYMVEKMPGILPKTLASLGYEDAWAYFEQAAA